MNHVMDANDALYDQKEKADSKNKQMTSNLAKA